MKGLKRHRVEDEEDEDEEDDNDVADEDEDLHPTPTPNPNPNPPKNNTAAEVVSGSATRISNFPPAVKYTLNTRAHVSHYTTTPGAVLLENISYGQLQVLSAVPADTPVFTGSEQDREKEASVVITPPPIMEGKGVLKSFWNRPHVVPLHADWFHPTTVHRLEKQVLPHYFSGKSSAHTPENYLDYRNLIVAQYLQTPLKTLTLADCQRLALALESDDLARLFRFLDHWGIINYCVPLSPYDSASSFDSYLREDLNGEVVVPVASLKSIDSLINFDKPKCRSKNGNVCPSVPSSYDDLADLDSRIRERLSDSRCNHCSRPLLLVFYQSVREADTLLCPDCYNEGRHVVGHSSLDFIKVDSGADYGDQEGDSWTDQETLLLLEGLELYNDNWNDIADHVGTKSKAQCILHFLRLPVEDGLLENIDFPGSSAPSNGSSKTDCDRASLNANGSHIQDSDLANKFPFANSGNPVMALVAFLASAVGPRIAAACAHASLAVLSDNEGLSHGNRVDLDESSVETRNFKPKAENIAAQGSQILNNRNMEPSPLSEDKVKSAAEAGLSAAALKAKLFADHEEREIQRLAANIINHQLKRLELKLKQFAEVETLLMKECEQVEKTRQRIAGERTRAMAARFGPSSGASSMNLPGISPQASNNSVSNSRPQAISASPSQPSIPGYVNNQMNHSQMTFLPRQQMFSFGPRLPLSAINPSSSGPSSSIMFGIQGSNQSSLNHPVLRPVPGTSSSMG